MDRPEYAITGSYVEFMNWRKEDPVGRANVIYLTAERAAQHTMPGLLHLVGTWEESPALADALQLEE